VTYPELLLKLQQTEFPMALLAKVHVADLKAFPDFAGCRTLLRSHERAEIYGDRRIDDNHVETVDFKFLDFSSAAERDKTIAQYMSADTKADSDRRVAFATPPEDEIYYYRSPDSHQAVRVDRWRGVPLD
jgi:hypothetical protein